MKQIIQDYGTGRLDVVDVPAPALRPNCVLVHNAASVVSVGTERYMLDLAKKGLVGKALARPDLVKQVVGKARSEGVAEAYRQAKGRLDTPVPLGYSAAGTVRDVGDSVTGFVVGDRLACAGSGIASHAEILRVPQTLAVKIPDSVSFEAAAFVALGGIALHAVRLAGLTFGERAVVLGLGLLGQLAVQFLESSGCRAFGLDVVPSKVEMALAHGAHAGATVGQDDVVSAVRGFSDGHGVDAVLVFASAESNQVIELAAALARERGRIVVPGLVGLDLPRKVFYEKELELVVSRAWGPGMYDPDYEAGQVDYPLPFVRWTAQRNMAHFLELLGDRRVTVDHLISHRFAIDQAVLAYDMILEGKETATGVVLQYPEQQDLARTIRLGNAQPAARARNRGEVPVAQGKDSAPREPLRIGLIGAGLFAKGTLLPMLAGVAGVELHGVATSTGASAEHVARKYSFVYCTTDPDEVLDDSDVDLVMIATRHGSHASLVSKALAAGKHVFVEKPLALDEEQLGQVILAYDESPGGLMVGFNRRFAPATTFTQEHLARVGGPLVVTVRANVGHIPREVWVHDPKEGGGNLVGEVCHYVDLIQALTGSLPTSLYTRAVRAGSEAVIEEDNVAITLGMADGSVGTVIYTTLGDKARERERVEVFCGGAVGVIDNFKTATWSQGGRRKQWGNAFSGVDRGHRAEVETLIAALQRGERFPVSFESYVTTTRATFAAMESLRCGMPVEVD